MADQGNQVSAQVLCRPQIWTPLWKVWVVSFNSLISRLDQHCEIFADDEGVSDSVRWEDETHISELVTNFSCSWHQLQDVHHSHIETSCCEVDEQGADLSIYIVREYERCEVCEWYYGQWVQ